jgi:hypothetical protein
MSRNDILFDSALAALAQALGLPQLAFDEDGLCHLSVEGTHGVTLRKDEERAALVLAGAIGDDFPETLHGALAADLLALALGPMHGLLPGIGYDGEMEFLVGYLIVPLGGDPDPFEEDAGGLFTHFVDFLMSVQRLLQQAEENIHRAAPPVAPTDAPLLRV